MSQSLAIEKTTIENRSHFLDATNSWFIFGIIAAIYTFLSFFTDQYILSAELYVRSLSGQLSFQSIESFLNLQENYQWVGYIFMPLLLLLKMCFAAICISIGIAFLGSDFKFKPIFKATLAAEIVFVGAQIWYTTNLYVNLSALTLQTLSNYYPLSLLSYFGTEQVVTWLHYPLQTLNLFEIIYVIVISWLLSKKWKPDFVESLSIVFPSYGTGLLLWLALVTFLSLQVS